MSTSTQNHKGEGGSYGGASFAPMTYDTDAIEPDAYAGEYEAKVADVKFRLTNNGGKPMIHLEWQITGAVEDTEECQKSVGSKVSDWIVLAADKTGNRGKVKLRTLRDTLELDPDVIPAQISSFADLEELATALRGQSMHIWVTTSTDNDGNVRTNVNYAAPRGAGGMAPMGDEEQEEQEAPKPAAKKSAPTKAAPKKAARR
jgi:Protein of unknown function (DUF669)